MFICTANTLDTIPGPLRDRMEIIPLAGYTEDEKLQIAKRYLVPRQIERNGLEEVVDLDQRQGAADDHRATTRARPGVRSLEREIGAVCRKVARQVAEGNGAAGQEDAGQPRAVRELLGKPQFLAEAKRRTARAGRRDRAGVDAGRRRRALHRGQRLRGQGQARCSPASSATSCRSRARAALTWVRGHLDEVAPGIERRLVRRARPAPPRAGRRDAQGRPERRHHDGDGAGLAAQRPRRCATTSR